MVKDGKSIETKRARYNGIFLFITIYTERKKKRRVNVIPKFHSSLKKFVKYFTMITKLYMYEQKFQISLVCDQQVSSY